MIERVDPRSDSYSALMWDVITNAHRYQPKPNDKVLDLGAHYGIFSLYCAARGARVEAYEPQESAFRELVHSSEVAKEIGAGSIRPWKWAVWSEPANLYLRSRPGESTATASVLREDGETVIVPAACFDAILVCDTGFDCVKMDVEGSEHQILTTSKELGRIRFLTVEIHNDLLLQEQTREIENVLRKEFPRVDRLPRKDHPEQSVALFCNR